jgi:hypothetical protein
VVANHSASLAHLFAHGCIDNTCFFVEQNTVATEVNPKNHAGRCMFGVWSDLGSWLIALRVWANANIGFV